MDGISDFVWSRDGSVALTLLSHFPPAVPEGAREEQLEAMIPNLAIRLIEQSAAGVPVFLPPRAHMSHGWAISLPQVTERLASAPFYLVLRPAGPLNHYRIDFGASWRKRREVHAPANHSVGSAQPQLQLQ
jgi:hypothetical protein